MSKKPSKIFSKGAKGSLANKQVAIIEDEAGLNFPVQV